MGREQRPSASSAETALLSIGPTNERSAVDPLRTRLAITPFKGGAAPFRASCVSAHVYRCPDPGWVADGPLFRQIAVYWLGPSACVGQLEQFLHDVNR
jgi:hypothetical protein